MGRGRGSNSTGVTQSCAQDGVNWCGRGAALCGIVSIAFYVVALSTSEWSKTDKLGTLGDGITDFGYAQFGLRQFCFDTEVALFEGEYLVCTDLETTISLFDESTGQFHNVTGCERFEGICDRSRTAEGSYAVAALLAIVGAVVSEKVEFNALFLALSAGAGCVGMSAWVNFQENQDAATGLELGFSLGLAVGAMLIAGCGSIMACCDMRFTDPADRVGFGMDGILISGRVASFGTVAVWVMLILAATMTDWSSTNDLGTAGNLCNRSDASVSCGRAEFGLWRYSVETPTPIFGGAMSEVALEYSESITTTSGTSGTGDERFSEYGIEDKRLAAQICVYISVVLAVMADVYNEKLQIAGILMLISGLGGLIAMSAWVSFQNSLSEDAGEKLKYDTGGWLCVGAWLLAVLVAGLYFFNANRTGEGVQRSSRKGKQSEI